MADIFLSLLGGVLIICLVFLAIYKYSRLQGKHAAAVIALLIIGIYVPVAILNWPGADVFAIHFAIYLVVAYILGIVTSVRDERQRNTGEKQGWFHWAPAAIVLFFVVVVAVNSTFVLLAQKGVDPEVANWLLPKSQSGGEVTSYFPGTVVQNFSDREKQQSKFRQHIAAQTQPDWTIRKGWLTDVHSDEKAVFKLQVLDENKQPVSNASIKGQFMRPGNSRLDIAFEMKEAVQQKGSYSTELVMPEPGNWNLFLRIQRGKQIHDLSAYTSIKPGAEK